MSDTFKKWLQAAGMRSLRTAAQVAIATIGTSTLIQELDGLTILSTIAVATILSLLTSIAGLPELEE